MLVNRVGQVADNDEKRGSTNLDKQALNGYLKALLSENDGIDAVLLSSIDGHTVLVCTNDPLDNAKMSAMTSSCLALGEKITLESKQKGCDFVIIQTEMGFLILKRIGEGLVLTVLADMSMSLGMLLSLTRATAERLEKQML